MFPGGGVAATALTMRGPGRQNLRRRTHQKACECVCDAKTTKRTSSQRGNASHARRRARPGQAGQATDTRPTEWVVRALKTLVRTHGDQQLTRGDGGHAEPMHVGRKTATTSRPWRAASQEASTPRFATAAHGKCHSIESDAARVALVRRTYLHYVRYRAGAPSSAKRRRENQSSRWAPKGANDYAARACCVRVRSDDRGAEAGLSSCYVKCMAKASHNARQEAGGTMPV